MALVTPVAVQDGTQTSGTTDYTLTGTTVTGRRSLADAVTDGDVANSDTLYYVVIDDTTEGGSLEWEYGVGTVSSSGAAVSRSDANVIESSNGGNRVSWGAGGTRTFIVVTGDWVLGQNNGSEFTSPATFATNLGLPRLAVQNFFTDRNQVITNSNAIFLALRRTASLGTLGDVAYQGQDSGGNTTNYARLRGEIADATDGSEDGKISFLAMVAGVETVIATADASGLKDASANKYDAFPSGTKLLFGATPPAGWTRSDETQSRVIRLSKSGDTIGATGGTEDLFDGAWTTDEAVLTEAQIPSHTHDVLTRADAGTLDGHVMTNALGGGETNRIISAAAQATGGGGSHNHAMFTPHYTIACWATKD